LTIIVREAVLSLNSSVKPLYLLGLGCPKQATAKVSTRLFLLKSFKSVYLICGFAEFICTSSAFPLAHWPILLEHMGDAIRHRGPDDSGVWCDADSGIGLSHRRLPILDLSPAGHQPMASTSGRYVIAFNGEIYNHLEYLSDKRNWRFHLWDVLMFQVWLAEQ
jgi:hypothetical protein